MKKRDPSQQALFDLSPQPRKLKDHGQRVIAWFSCGATSAIATKLAIARWGDRVEVVRIRLGREHADNDRFADDCAKWFGRPITEIGSARHKDHFEVALGERYINGPDGAKCSKMLKREVREDFQSFDDIQVFGFDADEEIAQNRAYDFRMHHPEIMLVTPLLDEGLGKADCLALLERAGIALPAMYLLGYNNNNCIACWKGGMGYWNKIRRDFPEAFTEAARIERVIGRSAIKTKEGQVFLDTLDPERGRIEDEPRISCGVTCFAAEVKISDAAA